MPDNWNTWTDAHKAEVVATKVMGANKQQTATGKRGRLSLWYCSGGLWMWHGEPYRPTLNIAQAWEVQERIVDLGLELEWAAMLITLNGISQVAPDRHDWVLATATPDQRCHAAVLAVKGEDDANSS